MPINIRRNITIEAPDEASICPLLEKYGFLKSNSETDPPKFGDKKIYESVGFDSAHSLKAATIERAVENAKPFKKQHVTPREKPSPEPNSPDPKIVKAAFTLVWLHSLLNRHLAAKYLPLITLVLNDGGVRLKISYRDDGDDWLSNGIAGRVQKNSHRLGFNRGQDQAGNVIPEWGQLNGTALDVLLRENESEVKNGDLLLKEELYQLLNYFDLLERRGSYIIPTAFVLFTAPPSVFVAWKVFEASLEVIIGSGVAVAIVFGCLAMWMLARHYHSSFIDDCREFKKFDDWLDQKYGLSLESPDALPRAGKIRNSYNQ